MVSWLIMSILDFVLLMLSSFMLALMMLFNDFIGLKASDTFNTFDALLPGVSDLGKAAIPGGMAICLIICIYQLFKSFLGPISEAEAPLVLVTKTVVTIVAVCCVQSLCMWFIGLVTPIYNNVLEMGLGTNNVAGMVDQIASAATSGGVSMSPSSTVTNTTMTALIAVAPGLYAFITICFVIGLLKKFISMLVGLIERYLVLGFLILLSPICVATSASKATKQICTTWVQMFLSQLILLISSVFMIGVFVKSFIMYMVQANASLSSPWIGAVASVANMSPLVLMFVPLAISQIYDQLQSFIREFLKIAPGGRNGGVNGAIGAFRDGLPIGNKIAGKATSKLSGVGGKIGGMNTSAPNVGKGGGRTSLGGLGSGTGTWGTATATPKTDNAAKASRAGIGIGDPKTMGKALNGSTVSDAKSLGNGLYNISGTTANGQAFSGVVKADETSPTGYRPWEQDGIQNNFHPDMFSANGQNSTDAVAASMGYDPTQAATANQQQVREEDSDIAADVAQAPLVEDGGAALASQADVIVDDQDTVNIGADGIMTDNGIDSDTLGVADALDDNMQSIGDDMYAGEGLTGSEDSIQNFGIGEDGAVPVEEANDGLGFVPSDDANFSNGDMADGWAYDADSDSIMPVSMDEDGNYHGMGDNADKTFSAGQVSENGLFSADGNGGFVPTQIGQEADTALAVSNDGKSVVPVAKTGENSFTSMATGSKGESVSADNVSSSGKFASDGNGGLKAVEENAQGGFTSKDGQQYGSNQVSSGVAVNKNGEAKAVKANESGNGAQGIGRYADGNVTQAASANGLRNGQPLMATDGKSVYQVSPTPDANGKYQAIDGSGKTFSANQISKDGAFASTTNANGTSSIKPAEKSADGSGFIANAAPQAGTNYDKSSVASAWAYDKDSKSIVPVSKGADGMYHGIGANAGKTYSSDQVSSKGIFSANGSGLERAAGSRDTVDSKGNVQKPDSKIEYATDGQSVFPVVNKNGRYSAVGDSSKAISKDAVSRNGYFATDSNGNIVPVQTQTDNKGNTTYHTNSGAEVDKSQVAQVTSAAVDGQGNIEAVKNNGANGGTALSNNKVSNNNISSDGKFASDGNGGLVPVSNTPDASGKYSALDGSGKTYSENEVSSGYVKDGNNVVPVKSDGRGGYTSMDGAKTFGESQVASTPMGAVSKQDEGSQIYGTNSAGEFEKAKVQNGKLVGSQTGDTLGNVAMYSNAGNANNMASAVVGNDGKITPVTANKDGSYSTSDGTNYKPDGKGNYTSADGKSFAGSSVAQIATNDPTSLKSGNVTMMAGGMPVTANKDGSYSASDGTVYKPDGNGNYTSADGKSFAGSSIAQVPTNSSKGSGVTTIAGGVPVAKNAQGTYTATDGSGKTFAPSAVQAIDASTSTAVGNVAVRSNSAVGVQSVSAAGFQNGVQQFIGSTPVYPNANGVGYHDKNGKQVAGVPTTTAPDGKTYPQVANASYQSQPGRDNGVLVGSDNTAHSAYRTDARNGKLVDSHATFNPNNAANHTAYLSGASRGDHAQGFVTYGTDKMGKMSGGAYVQTNDGKMVQAQTSNGSIKMADRNNVALSDGSTMPISDVKSVRTGTDGQKPIAYAPAAKNLGEGKASVALGNAQTVGGQQCYDVKGGSGLKVTAASLDSASNSPIANATKVNDANMVRIPTTKSHSFITAPEGAPRYNKQGNLDPNGTCMRDHFTGQMHEIQTANGAPRTLPITSGVPAARFNLASQMGKGTGHGFTVQESYTPQTFANADKATHFQANGSNERQEINSGTFNYDANTNSFTPATSGVGSYVQLAGSGNYVPLDSGTLLTKGHNALVYGPKDAKGKADVLMSMPVKQDANGQWYAEASQNASLEAIPDLGHSRVSDATGTYQVAGAGTFGKGSVGFAGENGTLLSFANNGHKNISSVLSENGIDTNNAPKIQRGRNADDDNILNQIESRLGFGAGELSKFEMNKDGSYTCQKKPISTVINKRDMDGNSGILAQTENYSFSANGEVDKSVFTSSNYENASYNSYNQRGINRTGGKLPGNPHVNMDIANNTNQGVFATSMVGNEAHLTGTGGDQLKETSGIGKGGTDSQ